MIDALQGLLPDPSVPYAPLIAGVLATGAILAAGSVLSLMVRSPGDLVTEGALPPRSLLDPEIRTGPPSPSVWVPPAPIPMIALALASDRPDPGTRLDAAPPGSRRIEVRIRVPHGRDCRQAMRLLVESCAAVPGVLDDPAPSARIAGLADTSIELTASVWAARVEADAVRGAVGEAVQQRLAQSGFDSSPNDIETV